MQRGEKIRELRRKKGLNQTDLAKIIGLTQGYISDIERGRQPPSPKFVMKISEPLEISKDDLSFLLGDDPSFRLAIMATKESRVLWPSALGEDKENGYKTQNINRERRLPQNAHKRRLINNVLKILESENKKVIKALKSNIEAFLIAIKKKETEIKWGD